MIVKHFFMNHGMLGMSQLPYPHCLMPANFFIFSKANTDFKEEDFRMQKTPQTVHIIMISSKTK
jgi:hypothetical protein